MTVFRQYADGQIVMCPCCLDRAALMKLDRYQRPYISCESCGGKVFFTNIKRARSLFFFERLASEMAIEQIRLKTSNRAQIVQFFEGFFPEPVQVQRPVENRPLSPSVSTPKIQGGTS